MGLMTQCGMNDKSANRLQSHKSHKHKQFPVFFDLDNNGCFSFLTFVHLCFFSSCLRFTHLRCEKEKVKEIEIGGIEGKLICILEYSSKLHLRDLPLCC